ncbi:hypothetical protein ACWD5R_11385 [Streptomyces sp. NPDC002514]|uniref:hypothetical protein n=1 Tax=Streptomyces sp. NPDC001270 TaxID=3364554 RepID=UPI0036C2D7A0
MKTRTAACAALLALTAALTACSSSEKVKADPAACKAALEKQIVKAPDPDMDIRRPAACKGIDDDTMQEYAQGIIGRHMNDDLNKAIDDFGQSLDDYANNLPTDAP